LSVIPEINLIVELLKGTSLGLILAILEDIRIGQKIPQGTNSPTY
jgi:hypothetical protein